MVKNLRDMPCYTNRQDQDSTDLDEAFVARAALSQFSLSIKHFRFRGPQNDLRVANHDRSIWECASPIALSPFTAVRLLPPIFGTPNTCW